MYAEGTFESWPAQGEDCSRNCCSIPDRIPLHFLSAENLDFVQGSNELVESNIEVGILTAWLRCPDCLCLGSGS